MGAGVSSERGTPVGLVPRAASSASTLELGKVYGAKLRVYRVTSLIRKRTLLVLYRSLCLGS